MPRRGLALRPVNSIKHIVDVATSAVAGGVTSVIPVVQAVDNPTQTAVADISTGAQVNAIYLRVECIHTGGTWNTVPRIYMAVQKNPGNEHPSANPSSIGDSDLRKFILHQEMMMVSSLTANVGTFPRTMFQGVVRIPPRLRRFGFNDRLQINFALDDGETSAIVNACVQVIYKEFR